MEKQTVNGRGDFSFQCQTTSMCNRKSLVGWFVVLLLMLFSPQPSQSQDAAFSTVSFGLNVSKDLNNADFQQRWRSKLAADAYAETPFYLGNVRIGARYLQAVSSTLTDIQTVHMRASWGPEFELADRVKLSMAGSIGSFYMSFVDEPVSYRKSESELVFGASTGLAIELSSHVSWELSAEWARAFTAKPLDFVFVSSGVRYTLASPKWLKSFLD